MTRLRRTRAARWARLVVLLALVVGCSSNGESRTSDRAALLASVMAGSDAPLSGADVAAVHVIGLDLVALRAPLEEWWRTLRDPAVPTDVWVAAAPARLEAMRETVGHLRAQIEALDSAAARETYEPYHLQWRAVLAALGALADAVRSGDVGAQQEATDAYNAAVGRITELDRARVQRVVDAYGAADARRALEDSGLDPARFGL